MFSKDSIYEDFCVDDVDLSFENYEELFGTSHIQTEQLFDDAGIDSYFESKEMPAGNSDEVCSLPLYCQQFLQLHNNIHVYVFVQFQFFLCLADSTRTAVNLSSLVDLLNNI